MGYNKFIISGKIFELYEYEKGLRIFYGNRKKKKTHQKSASNDDLVSDRKNEGQSSFQQARRRDNARRAVMAFRRLVLCQIGKFDNPLLITFTYAENIKSLQQGYKDFNAFIRSMRYKYGQSFRYVAVPEFQTRGAVHFHALFWGLAEQDSIVRQERSTRALAKSWKQGFVYVKQTDGNERLSSYLAKYMSKAFLSPNLANQRAYTSSRNCLRPIVGSGFDSIWAVLEEWELSTEVPCIVRDFDTQYLGKGRYSQYNLT